MQIALSIVRLILLDLQSISTVAIDQEQAAAARARTIKTKPHHLHFHVCPGIIGLSFLKSSDIRQEE